MKPKLREDSFGIIDILNDEFNGVEWHIFSKGGRPRYYHVKCPWVAMYSIKNRCPACKKEIPTILKLIMMDLII